MRGIARKRFAAEMANPVHHGPRRILVTGASGFVGRHLLAALAQTYAGAVLITEPFDVCDAEAVRTAVREAAPDACVHLAGVTAVGQAREQPDRAWQVNLHGTLNLARAVLAHAPDCRFFLISSAEVYGASFRTGEKLAETAPLAPMNTYAATKAAADLAIGAMVSEGLQAIRLRPFNHTGPGQTDAFVVPAFARQLARIAAGLQPPVLRVGALDPARDFLDVRDVCSAYAACLRQPNMHLPPGTILNLASGNPRRIGDVLAEMCRISGIDAEIESESGRMRPSDIPIACGDSGRARELLGWSPVIPWEQTLRDVWDDWRMRIRH